MTKINEIFSACTTFYYSKNKVHMEKLFLELTLYGYTFSLKALAPFQIQETDPFIK